jgi:hypothetical protein
LSGYGHPPSILVRRGRVGAIPSDAFSEAVVAAVLPAASKAGFRAANDKRL